MGADPAAAVPRGAAGSKGIRPLRAHWEGAPGPKGSSTESTAPAGVKAGAGGRFRRCSWRLRAVGRLLSSLSLTHTWALDHAVSFLSPAPTPRPQDLTLALPQYIGALAAAAAAGLRVPPRYAASAPRRLLGRADACTARAWPLPPPAGLGAAASAIAALLAECKREAAAAAALAEWGAALRAAIDGVSAPGAAAAGGWDDPVWAAHLRRAGLDVSAWARADASDGANGSPAAAAAARAALLLAGLADIAAAMGASNLAAAAEAPEPLPPSIEAFDTAIESALPTAPPIRAAAPMLAAAALAAAAAEPSALAAWLPGAAAAAGPWVHQGALADAAAVASALARLGAPAPERGWVEALAARVRCRPDPYPPTGHGAWRGGMAGRACVAHPGTASRVGAARSNPARRAPIPRPFPSHAPRRPSAPLTAAARVIGGPGRGATRPCRGVRLNWACSVRQRAPPTGPLVCPRRLPSLLHWSLRDCAIASPAARAPSLGLGRGAHLSPTHQGCSPCARLTANSCVPMTQPLPVPRPYTPPAPHPPPTAPSPSPP
jgi:hypothetical protein